MKNFIKTLKILENYTADVMKICDDSEVERLNDLLGAIRLVINFLENKE